VLEPVLAPTLNQSTCRADDALFGDPHRLSLARMTVTFNMAVAVTKGLLRGVQVIGW